MWSAIIWRRQECGMLLCVFRIVWILSKQVKGCFIDLYVMVLLRLSREDVIGVKEN